MGRCAPSIAGSRLNSTSILREALCLFLLLDAMSDMCGVTAAAESESCLISWLLFQLRTLWAKPDGVPSVMWGASAYLLQ